MLFRSLLLCQEVKTKDGPPCRTLWDHGSTTCLVTYSYANKAGLQGVDCSFQLTVVGGATEMFNTKIYVIQLLDRCGKIHNVCAFGIEQITSEVQPPDVKSLATLFSGLQEKDVENGAEGDRKGATAGPREKRVDCYLSHGEGPSHFERQLQPGSFLYAELRKKA